MSVELTLSQRLGNNLFQYALARRIADHHGLELRCRSRPLPSALAINGAGAAEVSSTLANLVREFPNAPLHLPGRRFDQPVEAWSGQLIDLNGVLNNTAGRCIRLDGYFQRYEYLAGCEGRIRQWFRQDPLPAQPKHDIVVSIRRGWDYSIRNWTLPLSYYDNALADIPSRGDIYICGVGIDQETKEHFGKYSPRYFASTPLNEFAFMASFNRIVLSNSTFAWWAAFLSDASEIYGPVSSDGVTYGFTGFADVDLHMRSPRYREVSTPPSEPVLFSSVTPVPDEKRVDKVWRWLEQTGEPFNFATIRQRFPGRDTSAILAEALHAGTIRLVANQAAARQAASSNRGLNASRLWE